MCVRTSREFGDRVKTWITFNEGWSFTFLSSNYGKARGHVLHDYRRPCTCVDGGNIGVNEGVHEGVFQ